MIINDKSIILDKVGNISALKIKFNLSNTIKEQLLLTYHFSGSMIEAIYCDINHINKPIICDVCGIKKAKFKNGKIGYSKWCGGSCATKASSKIGKKSHLSSEKIRTKIKKTLIKKYGVDNPRKINSVKNKIKNTSLEKYGVDSPLKSNLIKNKREKTNIEKYGVKNIGQVKEIIEKRVKTIKELYNVEHNWSDPEIRKKGLITYITNKAASLHVIPKFDLLNYVGNRIEYPWQCQKCNTIFSDSVFRGPKCPTCFPKLSGTSLIEKDIVKFLKQYYDGEIIENDRKTISPYELDILLPNLNIAIEINGLFYHSELNGTNKLYHLNKTQMCAMNGIKLIHIFEDELIHQNDIVKSRLLNIIGKSEKVYGRRCEVHEIDAKLKNEFLQKNHLQNEDKSKIKLGLFLKNDLMSVMTFGKPRFNKNYEWELIRFANKNNYSVIGGASKLFSFFIKNYNPRSIISYSDRRWGDGKLYEKLNFKFIEHTHPSYWYLEKYKFRIHRSTFMKHKISNNTDKTEWEIMKENGYDRIWDCGTSKWIFEK